MGVCALQKVAVFLHNNFLIKMRTNQQTVSNARTWSIAAHPTDCIWALSECLKEYGSEGLWYEPQLPFKGWRAVEV